MGTLIGACLSSSLDVFRSFNLEHGKTHKSDADYEMRRAIFMKNYNTVLEHNKRYEAGETSWWMKIHPDMDMTEEEWSNKYLGGLPHYDQDTVFSPSVMDPSHKAKLDQLKEAPKEWNWVDQGKVSSVKDQGQCGSCPTNTTRKRPATTTPQAALEPTTTTELRMTTNTLLPTSLATPTCGSPRSWIWSRCSPSTPSTPLSRLPTTGAGMVEVFSMTRTAATLPPTPTVSTS